MKRETDAVESVVVAMGPRAGDGAGDHVGILSSFPVVLVASLVGIIILVLSTQVWAVKKRASELWEVSRKLGLRFSPSQSVFLRRLSSLPAFRPSRRMSIQNRFRGESQGERNK